VTGLLQCIVQFAARRTAAGLDWPAAEATTTEPRGVADVWTWQDSAAGKCHPRTQSDADRRRRQRDVDCGWFHDVQKQFDADSPRQAGRLLFDSEWRVIAGKEE